MAWSMVLCELDTVALAGAPLGRIENAYDRQVTLGINGLGTASLKLRLDNPRAKEITDREGDVLLKVYQDSTLRLVAECVTAEEVWDADRSVPTLACTFANPMWRLGKRLVGVDTDGSGRQYGSGARRDTILNDLISVTNFFKDTGIRLGTLAILRVNGGAGPWIFKPVAEAFSDIAASFAPPVFETVSAYSSQDTFTAASTVALNGYVSSSGHAWSTFGGVPGDWNVDATLDYCHRTGVDVADEYNGRFGVLGSNLTNTLVEVEMARDGTLGSPPTLQGVLARSDGTTANYVRATVTTDVEGSQYVRVTKRIATGTPVDLWKSPPGTAMTIGPYNSIRLAIDDTGRWALWYWVTGETPTIPAMMGQDDDLATGGPLASGKAGIYDYNPGAATPNRGYDNFGAAVPAASLDGEALEFELVPTEPTPDTDADGVVGSGVGIAALNVATRLGADKPNVIFEQGDGIRTMKSYKRAISKDAQMNRGYVLPSDATPWPTGALIVRDDTASIAARGLFEDVVATDAGAAKGSVLDLHLQFRKQARQLITFDPSAADRYTYGTDYVVGDSVTGRAKFNGQERFNGLFRIYKVDISIDDEGTATISPTLTLD